MSPTMLLYIGAIAFTLMLAGLGLTIREFSQGKPKKQAEAARRGGGHDTAELKRHTA